MKTLNSTSHYELIMLIRYFVSAAQIDRIFIWGPPFPVHTVSPRRQGDGPKWGPNGPTKVPYSQCGQPNNKRPKSGIVLSFSLIKRILVGGWATHPTTLVVPIILTKEIQKRPWWLQPPIIQCANIRKSPSRLCRYALAVPWKSLDLRFLRFLRLQSCQNHNHENHRHTWMPATRSFFKSTRVPWPFPARHPRGTGNCHCHCSDEKQKEPARSPSPPPICLFQIQLNFVLKAN